MPIPQISDTIQLSHSNAGDASSGNGGDGFNYGNIDYNPVVSVNNGQAVYGSSTDLHNGDHVWQSADWEAGGGGHGGFAQAKDGFLASISNTGSGGAGGAATSNGSENNTSGHDTATVNAATTASQMTELMADQHANIAAGIGGNGGNGNTATGGSISPVVLHMPTTTETSTDLTSVTNTLDHFSADFGHIDLSHMGS